MTEQEKIYAVLLVKHSDGSLTVHFVVAPSSISQEVAKVLTQYPDCKVRVFERSWKKGYFSDMINPIW